MDETLVCWLLLAFVIAWRQLTTFECAQKCLHCLGPLTPFLQWYSFLFVGLGVLLFRTFYDIVVFDYIRYHFLSSQYLFASRERIPGLTDEEKWELRMHTGDKIVSLAAPVAGIVAFLIVATHVIANVRLGSRLRPTFYDDGLRWMPMKRQNMVLLVIAMPLVFIVMCMRAEIRMWAVMTGSAWAPFAASPGGATWEEVKLLQMSTYTTDLELASTFQYYTVWSFGRLCASYLTQAPVEYRNALTYAGLQGVYLFVLVGVVRTLGNFVVAVLTENPDRTELADQLREKALDKIGPVFTVATLLCVYNMIIIAKMKDVTTNLGQASLKFQATRLLLLASQIQLQVLTAISVGSKLYTTVAELPAPFGDLVQHWNLSIYRAKLLHASLLGFECLLVVVFNRFAWRPDARQYSDEPFDHSEGPGNAGYQALPGAA